MMHVAAPPGSSVANFNATEEGVRRVAMDPGWYEYCTARRWAWPTGAPEASPARTGTQPVKPANRPTPLNRSSLLSNVSSEPSRQTHLAYGLGRRFLTFGLRSPGQAPPR